MLNLIANILFHLLEEDMVNNNDKQPVNQLIFFYGKNFRQLNKERVFTPFLFFIIKSILFHTLSLLVIKKQKGYLYR